MIGCRAVGLRLQGFIVHSTKGCLDGVSCRELNCNSLWNASLEAMASARNLLPALQSDMVFNLLVAEANKTQEIGHRRF
jgi:hypothetical protein